GSRRKNRGWRNRKQERHYDEKGEDHRGTAGFRTGPTGRGHGAVGDAGGRAAGTARGPGLRGQGHGEHRGGAAGAEVAGESEGEIPERDRALVPKTRRLGEEDPGRGGAAAGAGRRPLDRGGDGQRGERFLSRAAEGGGIDLAGCAW